MKLTIRQARPEDVTLILQMIRELADFEQLLDQVVADEATLRHSLFSDPKGPEVLILESAIACGEKTVSHSAILSNRGA